MHMPEIVTRLMAAEVASGKATKRSLGVIYALGIGFMRPDDPAWKQINGAIRDWRGGDIRYLEDVKTVGWEAHDAMAKGNAPTAFPQIQTAEAGDGR